MKKPRVSVIIPTKNSIRTIEECLSSLKNQTYPHVEIIVVDNHSTDGTEKVAKKLATTVLLRGPERSAQRNFGAKHAKGEYFLFIDSDMKLDPTVVEECVSTITSKPIFHAVIIPEISFGIGFWAECKALERSFYLGVSSLEAARFFNAKTFRKFGGYDEKNTGTEDYALPQQIKAEYSDSAIGRISAFIHHNEGNLPFFHSLRKKFYYAQKLDSYVQNSHNSRHFKNQASLLQRYMLFFKNPRKLFARPLIGMGMLLLKTSEFGAGGLGYVLTKLKLL